MSITFLGTEIKITHFRKQIMCHYPFWFVHGPRHPGCNVNSQSTLKLLCVVDYGNSERVCFSAYGRIIYLLSRLLFNVFVLYTSGPVFLKERLVYTLNKLFVKQVKSFHLLLDLDLFILQCSLHNIEYIKFTSPQDISIKVIQIHNN